jgi:hypothetical protein
VRAPILLQVLGIYHYEILGAVHQYCSTNTIPYKPVKGEMVCTQFSSDQVWYRAEVEDVIVDKYCVQYVDFGNREIVTEEVIRKIDPQLVLLQLPSLLLECFLQIGYPVRAPILLQVLGIDHLCICHLQ